MRRHESRESSDAGPACIPAGESRARERSAASASPWMRGRHRVEATDRRPSRSRHRAGSLIIKSKRPDPVGLIGAPTCRQVDSSAPSNAAARSHRSGDRDGTAIRRLKKNPSGDVTSVTRGARFPLVTMSDQTRTRYHG